MSTIKALDTYLDRMAAKAAANPAKASIYQAKVDAKIANLIAKGKTVTNDGATITSYTISSGSSDGGSSGSTGTTGQTFTLTASVDAVPGLIGSSGSAGVSNNDTIQGIVGGGSSTFSLGDNLNGGSGTDVLNIIAISGTSTLLTSLDGIETVNIRVLDDQTLANDAAVFDAQDWSGVQVLSNASSLAASTLTVSGLAISTQVAVHGNTDVNVDFNLSTTGGTASVALINAGSAGTATTIGSANNNATGRQTANVDLDQEDQGFVTSVAVNLSGSVNLARIEGGSQAATMTITGSGNGALITDDLLTSFNATAASGTVDITFEGDSNVVAKGGFGNDTFRFGTTFSNSDSVDGGAGTDTVTLSVGSFARNLSTTATEVATVTFTEAAGAGLNVSGAASIGTYNLVGEEAGNAASISSIANAATINLANDNLGNVTLDYDSGAAATTLNLGSATGDVGVGTLTVTDVAAVSIVSVGGGSAGATASIGTASFDSDLRSLTISTSGGEADVVIGTTDADQSLGGATALTVQTNGSASFNWSAANIVGTSLSVITVTTSGSTAASATFDAVSSTALSTIVLNANDADISLGTLGLGNKATGASKTVTLDINVGASATAAIAGVNYSGAGSLVVDIAMAGTGNVDIGNIDAADGDAASAGFNTTVTLNPVTVFAGGNVAINSIDFEQNANTGNQLVLGAITVGQDAGFSAGAVSAENVDNVDVSNITLDVGASATATFANVETLGGAVGNILVTLAANATASFASISASGIGSISVTLATGASANFASLQANDGSGGTAAAVGGIEIVGVDGAAFSAGPIGASAVGAISVSGALDVVLGTITTTTMGTINATGLGASGSFTVNLSGVTNAVEVNLGRATNVITSGVGNDVITLTSGVTGNDTIRYNATAQGTDQIINFFAGSTGRDVIRIGTGINLLDGSGDPLAGGEMATAISFATLEVADDSTAMEASDNVVVITGTGFANWSGVIDYIGNGKSGQISFVAASAAGNLLVVWDNTEGDTVVSLATVTATVTVLTTGISAYDLAVLTGVTPGQLVAANFDISGAA